MKFFEIWKNKDFLIKFYVYYIYILIYIYLKYLFEWILEINHFFDSLFNLILSFYLYILTYIIFT